ncbi:hypothetical protein [Nonomuraea sp. NPDC050643]|uniref:hypothetical protein n=1 Tax=Nonomuraea sp. NPDC050643 TaxID=3155660 RepID=UPI0033CF7968
MDGDLGEPASLTPAAKGFDLVAHVGAPLGEPAGLDGVDALVTAGVSLLCTTGAAVPLRRAAPQTTSRLPIIIMSSCSRLWQWKT